MGEIGLVIMTILALSGWVLFFGTYLKYREILPFRVFKIPSGYKFAIIPLVDSEEITMDTTKDDSDERPSVQ